MALHVLVGATCLLGVGTTAVFYEQELFAFVLSRLPVRISSRVLSLMKTVSIPAVFSKSD